MALVKGVNSHVDVAEGDAYFEDRLDAETWRTASNTVKGQALVSATSALEEMPWCSVAVSESQSLAFPRTGLYFDPRLGYGVALNPTPLRVKKATMELALHLLDNPDAMENSSSISGLAIDSIKLFNMKDAPKMPNAIRRILKPLLINQGMQTWWRAN